MLFDRKPLIYIWRPVYRTVFVDAVWPFLSRVKAFFFLETREDLNHMLNAAARMEAAESRVEAMLTAVRQQNESIERRLAVLEAEQASQWNNLSKLLLCLYQQPKTTVFSEPSTLPSDQTARAARFSTS